MALPPRIAAGQAGDGATEHGHPGHPGHAGRPGRVPVEAVALGGRHDHLGGSGAFAARLHGVMGPLIVAILVTGRAIEARARQRPAAALHSLLPLRLPIARVVRARDDDGELVSPEIVPVGVLVRVRPG